MLCGPELQQVYQRFIELADRKKNVYEQDLLSILKAHKVQRMPVLPAEGRKAQAATPTA
jgi:hypothetical protein